MSEMKIIGHKKVLSYLLKIPKNTFPHTLLITGPSGVGKTTVANAVAANLIGCSLEQAKTHPSIFRLDAGTDPKTGARRKSIPVEAVRELRSLFQIRHEGARVILVEKTEDLQQESSNALLKVMEEPVANLYFILCGRSDESVLQTIKSRSAQVRLSGVPMEELQAGLLSQGIMKSEMSGALEIAEGRPGVALRYVQDAEFRERVVKERMRFSELRSTKTSIEAEKILSDLFGKKEKHIEARAELAEMLEWWVIWLRKERMNHPAILQIAKTIPLLFENMHPRLLVERIVIELQS